MILLFTKKKKTESADPLFRRTSPLSKGLVKSKGGLKTLIHYNADLAIAELLPRIIVSVNQPIVHGAIADWCQELAQRDEAHSPQCMGTLVAKVDNDQASQVPPEDVSSLTKGPPWSSRAQGNLVRQHEEKFGNLPEDCQPTNACDDAGFMINFFRGKFIITILDVHLEGYGSTSSCRGFSCPRSDDRSQPKGFIRGNTKIDWVLKVMVKKHSDYYGTEIKIDSMQEDGAQSTMVFSRGVDKNVTEFAVDHTRGCNKRMFQYCLDSDGIILYLWPIQGHSGGNRVDLSLQGHVQILHDWVEYIYQVGSWISCSSIIQSGPIAGGNNLKEGQTVFFAAVDPRNEPHRVEPYDVKGPRMVPHRTSWKASQNAVYWINLKSAQDRGLIFWQTNSSAIIFDDSVPADCLEQVVQYRARAFFVSKDSSVATSATEGYSQRCFFGT